MRSAREAAKFSLTDVAREFGLSKQAVSSWERGKSMPSAIQLADMAVLYGCSADAMLFGLWAFTDKMDHRLLELPSDIRNEVITLWQVYARRGGKGG
jgi:transcriptional regulator with XRE-family HTH domain